MKALPEIKDLTEEFKKAWFALDTTKIKQPVMIMIRTGEVINAIEYYNKYNSGIETWPRMYIVPLGAAPRIWNDVFVENDDHGVGIEGTERSVTSMEEIARYKTLWNNYIEQSIFCGINLENVYEFVAYRMKVRWNETNDNEDRELFIWSMMLTLIDQLPEGKSNSRKWEKKYLPDLVNMV